MSYWFWLLPWIIAVLLPVACACLWRHELPNKLVFLVISFLSALGVAFISTMLAGFVLEPLLRAVWQAPSFGSLAKGSP